MFYYTKPVPQVRGLRGSDLARAENLDSSGPYNRIGKQPIYGSGSGDGDGGGGDSSASCSKPITGGENGGDNNPTNLMTLGALTNCHQAGPPPNRPPSGGGSGCGRCCPRPDDLGDKL